MVERQTVLSVVLSLAVALVSQGTGTHATQDHATRKLPTHGVLVVGKNLAGVSIGQTRAQVRAVWGGDYILCTQAPCTDPTWLYFFDTGEPLGAAVRFHDKKVVAVLTLGAVPGWKSTQGVKIADPSSKVTDLYGKLKYSKCVGFEALSLRRNGVWTSFYLTAGVVYGFAITAPNLSVCQ